MKKYALLFALLCIAMGNSQTGVIKGIVIDKQSETPLVGATVELLNANETNGVITDLDGYFTLDKVPLGRQVIRVSYIGFESITLPNVVVTSGKDAVVNVALIEAFDRLDEVIITSDTNKARSINKLTSVSARQFSLEEVTRFSGGRSDVGRLAANFAGVSAPDDSRNDVVIRGNSPTGLLWRLEGVPIPSPNHYSTLGTTGGPVSALNPNLLKNSDFITSAFPAEYGNAIGGVFDLGFRNGNKDDYEYTAQVGIFTGIEAMAEGPLGKNNGSFLVAGRYSLVGLLGVGAGGTSAAPNYSDISFNLDFGKTKLGNFSLFGIIGVSDIDFLGDDIDEDDLFAAEDENTFVESRFGVIGLKHRINITDKSYLKTIISGSFTGNDFLVDRFVDKDTQQERIIRYTEADNTENRYTFSTLYNAKLSSRSTIRTGILLENIGVASLLSDRTEQPDLNTDGDPDLFTFRDIDENLTIIQPYLQGQFRLTEKLTLNAGIHGQYSSLNDQFVIEPRAGLNYKISQNHRLSFGYGLHHQPIPLPLLFLNEEVNGELLQTNKNLDFVRSNHYVLGYDIKLGVSWRGKVEIYYQDIDNAAVESFPSSYSSLTEGADFGFDNDRISLLNEGTGYNQGIELTLERFFSKGYYGLLTTSLFESKYEGSDGIERNTPFNNGYVINLLAGKEFAMGKTKKDVLFFDTRVTFSGGRYYTPVDLTASQAAGFEVLLEDFAFSEQNDGYFRWDVKFGYKINSSKKKTSHQFYVDLQNVTANENLFARRYNRLTNDIDEVNQIGFFPDFGYRFEF
ncbi:Outer membrane receptor proteins, mostly Fe transport [Aquimarina amphilecti]|uniref:Outer membrane receptor proteins, mostly Fe transport n=1 Tax=Aquimarina amphilecti TaxID=1038014 RepID=A0A1H7PPW0_AQUAM|nr:TonB-dependent receptor [Aquimarina amphilecti]SEL37444.1 Outer membrane receptor proteins, mostly Fe transport [Aquimarina amphilecti]